MKSIAVFTFILASASICALETLSSTVSSENYLTVAARGNWSLEKDNFSSDQILVFVYNNNAAGYNIGVTSQYGGFKHETVSSSVDSGLLELAWNCDSPSDVNGNSLIVDGGSSVNNSPIAAQAGTDVDILEIIDPDVATAGSFSICYATLVANEATAELYAGDYSDTITFTISNR